MQALYTEDNESDLIQLESPENGVKQLSFDTTIDDKMITSFENIKIDENPFDEIENESRYVGNDNLFQMTESSHTVPTGSLIDVCSTEEDMSYRSLFNNSHSFRVPPYLKTKHLSESKRSNSLNQMNALNQFLKNISNSPTFENKSEVNLDKSLSRRQSFGRKLFNLDQCSKDLCCEDLMSTNPEWIESENEDFEDFERMTIPCLKNIPDISDVESTICDTRDNIVQKLSKYKSDLVEENKTDEIKENVPPSILSSTNAMKIIEDLRQLVNECGNESSKLRATALLDSLGSIINTNASNASSKTTIERQRTFSIDNDFDDSPNLSTTLPSANNLSMELKSVSGNLCDSIVQRQMSKSMLEEPAKKELLQKGRSVTNVTSPLKTKKTSTTLSQLTRSAPARNDDSKKSESLPPPRQKLFKLKSVSEKPKPKGPLITVNQFQQDSVMINAEMVPIPNKQCSGSTLSRRSFVPCRKSSITEITPEKEKDGNKQYLNVSSPKMNKSFQTSGLQKRRSLSNTDETDIVFNTNSFSSKLPMMTPLNNKHFSRSFSKHKSQ